MPVTPEDLAKQAMELTPEGRAQLADLLVESLDSATLSEIDLAWLTEAQQRLNDHRSGKVAGIPVEQAMKEVRDKLER